MRVASLAAGDMHGLSEADGQFPQALYETADNAVLLNMAEQMREQFPRYMLLRSAGRVRHSIKTKDIR